jgi:hypothetical protein
MTANAQESVILHYKFIISAKHVANKKIGLTTYDIDIVHEVK